jgi:hypothetical protein
MCGWCALSNRTELERRVLDGETIVSVALDTPYGPTAAHSHFRNHVAKPALAESRASAASRLQIADFGERILSLADDAAAAREHAVRTNDAKLMLLAIREESSVLATMISKLGLDSTETLENLHQGKALAQAISNVLRDQPTLARAMARELSESKEPELAQAFYRLSDLASSRQIAQLAKTKRSLGIAN